ncbi:hypothetical protein GQ85_25215 [Rhodococcus rhodochrous]|nr:hypothetical protein GQ85_25215 [Rhodococcus rhodochrous]
MSRRRKIAAAWIAVAVLALSGCGEPPEITSGTVIGKDYTPEQWLMVPISTSCGQNCTTTTLMPVYEPARYVIHIGACDGDCKTASFSVEPSTYHDLEIGERYPRSAPAIPKGAP